ncbi:MAG: methylase [Ilumatobacteraceae bacterium]|nr:methylase [Ilumatobacteraceae bacterium]
MDLITLPGVFRPISDSQMLADAVGREPIRPGSRSLDLCTGSGIVAIAAAQAGCDATAVDVSRRALATTALNARRNGQRVHVRRGHLFEPVADRRFHLITSNPPYVPSPTDDLPRHGRSRAWVAGRDGRTVIDEICAEAAAHLLPGGVVMVVHSSLCDEEATIARLRASGLVDACVTERDRGPLGPLMREQQALGTIPSDVDEEDVVIIRATAPGTAARKR